MMAFPHIVLLVMGTPRISGMERHVLVAEYIRQAFLAEFPVLISHKKEKDVKEAWDRSEQSSQNLMKNASSYNHF